MSSASDLRFGRIAVTKSFLTEDVLTEILIHQAADAITSGGIAKPLYQVCYDGGWLDEDSVQGIRLAQRLQEFLDGEKELADLVVKHGIADRDIVESILNQQRDLFKQTDGSPPGIATMLADEGELDEKKVKALRTLEQRMRRGPDKPTVIKVLTGPAAMPPLPPGMTAATPTPQPGARGGTKSGKPKCPGCGAALPSVEELHCDACGALFCPKCRGVVKAEDIACAGCGNSLRAVEPEPKSHKGLVALIVVVVLLAGGGIALGPGGLYEKLVGPSIDYAKAARDADATFDSAEEEINKGQADEAKATLADAEKRVEALAGKIPEDRLSVLRTRVKLTGESIVKLEKRIADKKAEDAAAEARRAKQEQSYALVEQAKEADDPKAARALLEQALQLLPENASAWHQLGVMLNRDGKRDEAKKLLGGAVDKGQLGTLGFLLLGQWAREANDPAAARSRLNAVFSVPPALDGPDSPELQKQVLAARKEAHRLLVITELEDPNGKVSDAINHFHDMGDLSGIDAELILRIADVYRMREEMPRAAELYRAHLDRHPDCKRRILLEWRIRRLTKDDSEDAADIVIIREAPTVAYFLTAETDKDLTVRNLPGEGEEVALPKGACDVVRGGKNPMATAFDMFEKRMGSLLPLSQVEKRVAKVEEFVNEAHKAGVPPACVKRFCMAELEDLESRDPKNARLVDLLSKLRKWTISAPSVKPPPPEEGSPLEGPTGPVGPNPTATRTFDPDKVWSAVYGDFKRGKDKFGDPAKANERNSLEDESIRHMEDALKDAKPTDAQPARKWYEKFLTWAKPVAQTFLGDASPKAEYPFDREGNLLSHAAVEVATQCIAFAASPAAPITPQQAFESYLGDLVAIRKQFPGLVRYHTVLPNGQEVSAGDRPGGTVYLRRDALEVRTAVFASELAASTGGQTDDTVKFKEKELASIASKLPLNLRLEKYDVEKETAFDPGEDVGAAARTALDATIEKVRK